MARKSAKRQYKPEQPNTRGKVVWVKAFLAQLRRNGNVTSACDAADVGRTTVYEKRRTDPAFEAAWNDALEEAADRIEEEAHRRAVEGYDAPVWYKGQLVGVNREYSDTLMQMMLKGHKPGKYADKLMVKIDAAQAGILKESGLPVDEAFSKFVDLVAVAVKRKMDATKIMQSLIDELYAEPVSMEKD